MGDNGDDLVVTRRRCAVGWSGCSVRSWVEVGVGGSESARFRWRCCGC